MIKINMYITTKDEQGPFHLAKAFFLREEEEGDL